MNKALVVDDEEDICQCLKEELEELGLNVSVALTGEEALKLIESEYFDLAIIDMRLATEITGLDIIKAVRDKQTEALVFAMTGYIDIGLRQKVESLGVRGFLEKPNDVQPDVFAKKIRKFIEK